MATPKINRDTLNMADPGQVARTVLGCLDRIQDQRPEVQLMASAAMFLELAEALGIPAQEAFSATKNLMNGQDGKRSEFVGLALYIEGEIVT